MASASGMSSADAQIATTSASEGKARVLLAVLEAAARSIVSGDVERVEGSRRSVPSPASEVKQVDAPVARAEVEQRADAQALRETLPERRDLAGPAARYPSRSAPAGALAIAERT